MARLKNRISSAAKLGSSWWICLGAAVTLYSCSYRPRPFPPLLLLQAVLPSKFLILSGSFYIWNLLRSPCCCSCHRERAYHAGHRHKSEWVRSRGYLSSWFLALHLFSFCAFPREPQTLLLARERNVYRDSIGCLNPI